MDGSVNPLLLVPLITAALNKVSRLFPDPILSVNMQSESTVVCKLLPPRIFWAGVLFPHFLHQYFLVIFFSFLNILFCFIFVDCTFLFSFILNILATVLSTCLLNLPPFSSLIHSHQYQFSLSVVSDSLQQHGLHYARPPCPSPTPRIYSNSCPLSRWCNPTISSSVVFFSYLRQSFPASRSLVAKVLEFQL